VIGLSGTFRLEAGTGLSVEDADEGRHVLRHVEGPDRDILEKDEVCHYLRVDASQLDRLIRRKEFPRGVPYGEGKILVWYWEDCFAFRHLRMRLQGSPDPEPEPPGTTE
jgi:predicted DNA-binding transcriptional regulator AlpA